MDAPPSVFDPPAGDWQRPSPRLATVTRLGAALGVGLTALLAAAALWFAFELWWPPVAVLAAALVLYAGLFWHAGRWAASWGWTERDGDLCVRHGLAWRTLLVVPFARLQLVKVTSGPLQRLFGLSTVELVTASVATRATIPGLPTTDAVALRDRLIGVSDALGSGL